LPRRRSASSLGLSLSLSLLEKRLVARSLLRALVGLFACAAGLFTGAPRRYVSFACISRSLCLRCRSLSLLVPPAPYCGRGGALCNTGLVIRIVA
jgi:hypothetical protein